jgi:hypothetical protein
MRIYTCTYLSLWVFVRARNCPCAELSLRAFVACASMTVRFCLCGIDVSAFVVCAFVRSPNNSTPMLEREGGREKVLWLVSTDSSMRLDENQGKSILDLRFSQRWLGRVLSSEI